jgi:ABC-2 type transport system permease protein
MALYDVLLVTVFGILAVKGLRSEETRGRAEPVLAAGVGRVRWVASHLLVAYSAATAILLLAGLAFGIGAAIGVDDPSYIVTVTLGHLARAPEAFVFMAVAAALYGVFPRALGLAWAVLAYAGLLAFFGPLLNPPAWLHNLSPMDHIARIPIEDFTILPVVVLLAIAGLLTAVGLVAFSRRDLDG